MDNVKDAALLLTRARKLQANVSGRPWNRVFGNCGEIFDTPVLMSARALWWRLAAPAMPDIHSRF